MSYYSPLPIKRILKLEKHFCLSFKNLLNYELDFYCNYNNFFAKLSCKKIKHHFYKWDLLINQPECEINSFFHWNRRFSNSMLPMFLKITFHNQQCTMGKWQTVSALVMVSLSKIKISCLPKTYWSNNRSFSISALLISVPGNRIIIVPI